MAKVSKTVLPEKMTPEYKTQIEESDTYGHMNYLYTTHKSLSLCWDFMVQQEGVSMAEEMYNVFLHNNPEIIPLTRDKNYGIK